MAEASIRTSVTIEVSLNPEEVGLICDAIQNPLGNQHINEETQSYSQMREELYAVLKTVLVKALAAG